MVKSVWWMRRIWRIWMLRLTRRMVFFLRLKKSFVMTDIMTEATAKVETDIRPGSADH